MNRFFETARLLKVVMGFALVAWALESPAAGAVAPPCGDGVCSSSEISTCPADCLVVNYNCGNGVCNISESCDNCEQDCAPCSRCGNGRCGDQESCQSCPQDCGTCGCGNAVCDPLETCSTCAMDCGTCSCDRDGRCERDRNETCSNCLLDCGSCTACDHDGQCDAGETLSSCANDCSFEPPSCVMDGVCAFYEDCASGCSECCGSGGLGNGGWYSNCYDHGDRQCAAGFSCYQESPLPTDHYCVRTSVN
jgi:hypothetical protein